MIAAASKGTAKPTSVHPESIRRHGSVVRSLGRERTQRRYPQCQELAWLFAGYATGEDIYHFRLRQIKNCVVGPVPTRRYSYGTISGIALGWREI
jgi:hypothetical protein